MKFWILFLAALAAFCAAVAVNSFHDGDTVWGSINAACVVINLANMYFWLHVLDARSD